MSLFETIDLQDCPYCGGAGILEEEGGFCWYVVCADCGSQTAASEYAKIKDREEAAKKAAALWNIGKVVRGNISE